MSCVLRQSLGRLRVNRQHQKSHVLLPPLIESTEEEEEFEIFNVQPLKQGLEFWKSKDINTVAPQCNLDTKDNC